MPLQRLTFIHVGDIHFPDLRTLPPLGDAKDSGYSKPVVKHVVIPRTKHVADEIARLLTSASPVHGVIFSGDLTTQGDFTGYQQCVTYLSEVLQLSEKAFWSSRLLVVVPGNHDVERPAAGGSDDSMQKFERAAKAWESAPINGFHHKTPSTLTVSEGNCTANIFPLNTCLGCGEYRYLPEAVRKVIIDTLETYSASLADKERFELLGERLDSPAIADHDIQALRHKLVASSKESGLIVVGHHPLLPQPLPRVAAYTELINAGHFRRSLLETNRRIVYLHGHIHQDPIEYISAPDSPGARVISISAPAFSDGFNLLSIAFSERGTAIAIEITPFRFHFGPDLVRLAPTRCCIVGNDEIWNEISAPLHRALLDLLHTPAQVFRFDDLCRALVAQGALDETPTSVTSLEQELEVLELLGAVHIGNRASSARNWQLRRISP